MKVEIKTAFICSEWTHSVDTTRWVLDGQPWQLSLPNPSQIKKTYGCPSRTHLQVSTEWVRLKQMRNLLVINFTFHYGPPWQPVWLHHLCSTNLYLARNLLWKLTICTNTNCVLSIASSLGLLPLSCLERLEPSEKWFKSQVCGHDSGLGEGLGTHWAEAEQNYLPPRAECDWQEHITDKSS